MLKTEKLENPYSENEPTGEYQLIPWGREGDLQRSYGPSFNVFTTDHGELARTPNGIWVLKNPDAPKGIINPLDLEDPDTIYIYSTRDLREKSADFVPRTQELPDDGAVTDMVAGVIGGSQQGIRTLGRMLQDTAHQLLGQKKPDFQMLQHLAALSVLSGRVAQTLDTSDIVMEIVRRAKQLGYIYPQQDYLIQTLGHDTDKLYALLAAGKISNHYEDHERSEASSDGIDDYRTHNSEKTEKGVRISHTQSSHRHDLVDYQSLPPGFIAELDLNSTHILPIFRSSRAMAAALIGYEERSFWDRIFGTGRRESSAWEEHDDHSGSAGVSNAPSHTLVIGAAQTSDIGEESHQLTIKRRFGRS
jgi:hypothetical protein